MNQYKRPFPVPEPMWPNKEEKVDGKRPFNVIIVADFRYDYIAIPIANELQQLKKKFNRIGLVQMYNYDLSKKDQLQPSILDNLMKNTYSLSFMEKRSIQTIWLFTNQTSYHLSRSLFRQSTRHRHLSKRRVKEIQLSR